MKYDIRVESLSDSPFTGVLSNKKDRNDYSVMYTVKDNLFDTKGLLLFKREALFFDVVYYKINDFFLKKDILNSMLEKIREVAINSGMRSVCFSNLIDYSVEDISDKEVFYNNNWSDFYLKKFILRFDKSILQAPVVKTFNNISDYEIMGYDDVMSNYYDYLFEHSEKKEWEKMDVCPFSISNIQKEMSYFLINGSVPVGWMIGNVLYNGTINYASCNIMRSHRNSVAGHVIITKSLLSHDWEKYPYGVCNCLTENREMINMYKRRFIPYVLSAIKEYRSELSLI